jgi:hypothetical protein
MPPNDLLPKEVLNNALALVLAGLVTSNNAGIVADDTVLGALGKLQAQVAAMLGQDQVGAGPAQVPAGQFLGDLAYLSRLGVLTPMQHQPAEKRSVWTEFVNDTTLKLCMRGDDGAVRSFTWTLT